MDDPILIVDARNALYRAIHAMKAERRYKVKYHYFVVFLRQLANWMNKFRPSSVHVFWDAPRTEVWRRKVLSTYKDRPSNLADISEELATTTEVAKNLFQYMNVRQYERKQMEADDLIYAAVTISHPRPTVVVSTDSDLVQLPFVFNSCTLFDPKKQKEVPIPDINPVMQKALAGDRTDAINGYNGIGPKKSADLLCEPTKLQEFLDKTGHEIYRRNMLLIDLSLNPRILANKIYMQRKMAEQVSYDEQQIMHLMKKYQVNGLMTEFTDLVLPFKKLS